MVKTWLKFNLQEKLWSTNESVAAGSICTPPSYSPITDPSDEAIEHVFRDNVDRIFGPEKAAISRQDSLVKMSKNLPNGTGLQKSKTSLH